MLLSDTEKDKLQNFHILKAQKEEWKFLKQNKLEGKGGRVSLGMLTRQLNTSSNKQLIYFETRIQHCCFSHTHTHTPIITNNSNSTNNAKPDATLTKGGSNRPVTVETSVLWTTQTPTTAFFALPCGHLQVALACWKTNELQIKVPLKATSTQNKLIKYALRVRQAWWHFTICRSPHNVQCF